MNDEIVRSSRIMLNKQDFIEGTSKSMAVLECFSAERQRINATQAAERTGITRAAARRHLLTLQHLGYLEGDAGYFWLTPRVLRLAGIYLSSARLPRAVQPTLDRLASDTGQAFSVAVLDGEQIVIVARSGEHRSKSAVMPSGIHLGARLPAFATSTGRVLLAELSQADLKLRMGIGKFIAFTPKTLVGKKLLVSEIAKISAQGFAEATEEHEFGVRALAVPVRNMQGQAVAALNIVDSSIRAKSQPLAPQYLEILLRAGAEIRNLL
jgi:IclR family transcriptional regulator, pca regulon regulatory protein